MENYRKIEIKGKGSFGQAILVQSVSDRKFYIMKVIDVSMFDRKQKEYSINEINVLKSLHHPFIIRYRESFVDKNKYLCIAMDYADDGNLEEKIKLYRSQGLTFSEDQVLDWFTQICLAIKYIHDKKIIHRDVKTQNIFLTKNNQIKLGDFGISKMLMNTEELCKTNIGTPYYISPEIYENKPYNNKSDIWSLGCILVELLTLRRAFEAKSVKGLYIKVLRTQTPLISNSYSQNVRDLVSEILVANPEQRPTIDEILDKDFIKMKAQVILEKLKASKVVQNFDEQQSQYRSIVTDGIDEKFVQSQDKIINIESNADQIELMRCKIEQVLDFDKFLYIYQAIQVYHSNLSNFQRTIMLKKLKKLNWILNRNFFK